MYSPASLGNILIVDDDSNIVDLLSVNLKSEGYSVRVIGRTSEVRPDDLRNTHLMLVDGADQEPTGCELIGMLKATPEGAPVGMIYYSEYDSERVLIEALDAGADDSVRKPFSLREILARVRAVMRRRRAMSSVATANVVRFKNKTVDLQRREVTVGGEPAGLSNTEFAILELLLRNTAGYTSRVEIFKSVWPEGVGVNERIVDTNISRLRRKLGPLGACIVNRSGLGYMLAE